MNAQAVAASNAAPGVPDSPVGYGVATFALVLPEEN